MSANTQCKECKRRLPNEPLAKLAHMAQYHPLSLLTGFQKMAPVAKQIGERIGRKVRNGE